MTASRTTCVPIVGQFGVANLRSAWLSVTSECVLRMVTLKRSRSYKAWLASFKQPFSYDPRCYHAMGLKNDFTIYFGNPYVSTLKVK